MKRILIVTVLLFLYSVPLWAAPVAQSGPQKVSLVEVYSSEGCSSCPPAEEWVSRLTKDPHLWKNYVPVVFHVDYWDRLGWKDRFSDNQFTERQRIYASAWGSGDIYTPGFVLDGREWRDWYRVDSIDLSDRKNVGVLSVEKSQDSHFKITFKPEAISGSAHSYTVNAALLVFNVTVDVKAGENAGRRIKHDFTAAAYAQEAMERSPDNSFQKEVSLKIPQDLRSKKIAIAVWVSTEKSIEPIQSAGNYL